MTCTAIEPCSCGCGQHAAAGNITQLDSRRRPLGAPITELLDSAAEMLDLVGMTALADAVRDARRQHGRLPGTVKASLGDHELVVEQLKLKIANGTPGTADYVFARDLLSCIGPIA